jgi:transposase
MPLTVSPRQRQRLEQLVRDQQSGRKLIFRASIVLGVADGKSNSQLARELRTSRPTVIHWRKRFGEDGMGGLRDMPRCGRRKSITAAQVAAIKAAAVQPTPAGERWTTRALARAQGVSHATVFQIWKSCAPQRHRWDKFRFTLVRDIVGLYVNSPEAVVVFIGERRRQSPVPAKANPAQAVQMRVSQRTPARYERERSSLVSILDVLGAPRRMFFSLLDRSGKPDILPYQHDSQLKAFLHFLNFLDRRIPKRWDVHLVATSTEIRDEAELQQWFSAHLRFHVHYPPSGAEWSSVVATWLSEMSRGTLALSSTRHVHELLQHIMDQVAECFEAVPFLWFAHLPFAYRLGCQPERRYFKSIISAMIEMEHHFAMTAFRKRPRTPNWSIWS